MRRSVIVFLVLSALMVSPGPLQAQSKDEQAIRALLNKGIQAGNSVDPKVIQQLFADYARAAGPFYPPFGNNLASVPEVEAFATQFLNQLSSRSYSVAGPIKVRVDKNLAWASYAWRAEAAFKDGTRRSFDGRSTVTFVREGKAWKVAHWHSSFPATLPATSSALSAEAQTVLQIERDAWEALKNKQTAGMGNYFAEEASIFAEDQAYRVKGKAEIVHAIDNWLRQATLRSYQMLDPQVQVLGDTALLTYYFTETVVAGGKEQTNAGKMSIVFVKQDGTWRALHEHRSVNR